MESVNVTEEAVGFPSIEPTAVVDARVAVTEAAANRISRISRIFIAASISASISGRDLMSRKHIARECLRFHTEYRFGRGLPKEFDRVVNEAVYVERAKSLIEKVRTSQFIEEASIAKVNAALSEGLFKFFEALAEAIAAEILAS